MLSRPSSIKEDAIEILPKVESNVLSDEFQTVMETRKTVQQLSFGKAPRTDAIHTEVVIPDWGLGATHGRKTNVVVSLYVEEGGYPTRI